MLLLLNRNTQLSFIFICCLSFISYSHAFFSYFTVSIIVTQPQKKTTQKKLAPPLQSLVRISTARANAHNTIAHFRHTQITKIKIACLEQLVFL